MKIMPSIERDSRNYQAKSEKLDRLPDHQIEVIWGRMAEIYGDAWQNARGPLRRDDGSLTAHAKAWADALADFTPPQIAYGLTLCRDNPGRNVPHIAKFHALCTG